jgi:hypothetical protein
MTAHFCDMAEREDRHVVRKIMEFVLQLDGRTSVPEAVGKDRSDQTHAHTHATHTPHIFIYIYIYMFIYIYIYRYMDMYLC